MKRPVHIKPVDSGHIVPVEFGHIEPVEMQTKPGKTKY